MSGLIKGFTMPNSCYGCRFLQLAKETEYCLCNMHPLTDLKTRPKSCPLSEVPTPHGDLIDKEQLKQLLLDLWQSRCNYTISDLIREIVDIKPIIEAEE